MSKAVEVLLPDGTEFKGDIAEAMARMCDQFSPTSSVESRNVFVTTTFELFQEAGWTAPGEDIEGLAGLAGGELVLSLREGEHAFDVDFGIGDNRNTQLTSRTNKVIRVRAASAGEVALRVGRRLCELDGIVILGYRPTFKTAGGIHISEEEDEPFHVPPKHPTDREMCIFVLKQGLTGFEIHDLPEDTLYAHEEQELP